jgi:hypothetical protein
MVTGCQGKITTSAICIYPAAHEQTALMEGYAWSRAGDTLPFEQQAQNAE